MRTLVLTVLAIGAVLLAVLLRPPAPKTRAESVTGARLVRIPRHAISRIALTLDRQQLTATRTASGWAIDTHPTEPTLTAALDDLATALAQLRAVDQFRPAPQQAFGFDPPRGTIVVSSSRRETHLDLGALTASATTLYARRANDPRVFQIGTYLLAQLTRVIDRRAAAAPRS